MAKYYVGQKLTLITFKGETNERKYQAEVLEFGTDGESFIYNVLLDIDKVPFHALIKEEELNEIAQIQKDLLEEIYGNN
jgi:hypothetical protein